MSCYIMQDDLAAPGLKVIEAMTFAADLKLGRRKSQSEKRFVVSITFRSLILWQNILVAYIEG